MLAVLLYTICDDTFGNGDISGNSQPLGKRVESECTSSDVCLISIVFLWKLAFS